MTAQGGERLGRCGNCGLIIREHPVSKSNCRCAEPLIEPAEPWRWVEHHVRKGTKFKRPQGKRIYRCIKPVEVPGMYVIAAEVETDKNTRTRVTEADLRRMQRV